MHKKVLIISVTLMGIIHTQPVDLTVKMHEGAGFFAELHKLLQAIIYFEDRGLSRVYVDWTDEFFPYKDDPYENGWDLFFEPHIPYLIKI